ncbi:hypothetical protein SPI_04025 [Niveomyces insectorum RCEF 264]|uniref:AB hydrolase-1 domain-containing protein n=1 Tax=Niveomyces insectorum RCEF 264 TaxID=1081102 RepID=A0A167VD77_9HYPO|nr:hypothetical protein SPI_04025 [Niveomyces insectorum RCEF 264]
MQRGTARQERRSGSKEPELTPQPDQARWSHIQDPATIASLPARPQGATRPLHNPSCPIPQHEQTKPPGAPHDGLTSSVSKPEGSIGEARNDVGEMEKDATSAPILATDPPRVSAPDHTSKAAVAPPERVDEPAASAKPEKAEGFAGAALDVSTDDLATANMRARTTTCNTTVEAHGSSTAEASKPETRSTTASVPPVLAQNGDVHQAAPILRVQPQEDQPQIATKELEASFLSLPPYYLPTNGVPLQASTSQPTDGVPWHMRTTAYIDCEFSTESDIVVKRVYVERLRPQRQLYPAPILLIQGDFHSSDIWLTKPDGHQGWASAFLGLGYEVILVDLPPFGRSMNSPDIANIDGLTSRFKSADIRVVESEYTAPKKHSAQAWPSASLHTKWPGTGLCGDPCFGAYVASLGPSLRDRAEQQRIGQKAVASVVQWLKVPATILVGEGSGATLAWLAADAVSDLIAGVIAVEPDGPPFSGPAGCTHGITNIPLTFDPPLGERKATDTRIHQNSSSSQTPDPDLSSQPPALSSHVGTKDGAGKGICSSREEPKAHAVEATVQTPKDNRPDVRDGVSTPRLVHLAKIPHAIVTAEASSHSTFDGATVDFLSQAGVDVQWLQLQQHGIHGNGHLCFLETNSHTVAGLLALWMQTYILSARPLDEYNGQTALPMLLYQLPQAVMEEQDAPQQAPTLGAGSGRELLAFHGPLGQTFEYSDPSLPSVAPSLRDVNMKYHESINHELARKRAAQPGPGHKTHHASWQAPQTPLLTDLAISTAYPTQAAGLLTQPLPDLQNCLALTESHNRNVFPYIPSGMMNSDVLRQQQMRHADHRMGRDGAGPSQLLAPSIVPNDWQQLLSSNKPEEAKGYSATTHDADFLLHPDATAVAGSSLQAAAHQTGSEWPTAVGGDVNFNQMPLSSLLQPSYMPVQAYSVPDTLGLALARPASRRTYHQANPFGTSDAFPLFPTARKTFESPAARVAKRIDNKKSGNDAAGGGGAGSSIGYSGEDARAKRKRADSTAEPDAVLTEHRVSCQNGCQGENTKPNGADTSTFPEKRRK